MTIRTIECADCGTTVPSGRLACPSCGVLLAAVAGAPPPPIRVIETPSETVDAAAESPRKGSRAKKRSESNRVTVASAVTDGTAQPASKRATQAVSRAATAAGRAATAATAKAKTTAAAATAAVAPAKASAKGGASPTGNRASAFAPAAAAAPASTVAPRSPGKVAAAIALAVAATPTAPDQPARASSVVAPKAPGGSRPYPVPTAAPMPSAPMASVAAQPAAEPARQARPAAMPAAVAAPPTASRRPAPMEEPAHPVPVPAQPRPAPATPQARVESTTGSAPAQLAYLIDPAPNGRGRSPELTTNGTSAYLLDPEPFDDEVDEAAGSPWPPLLQPEPALVGRPYVSGSITAGGPAAMPPRPGAYLPPNSVLPPSSVSRPAVVGAAGTQAAGAAAASAVASASPAADGIPATMPGATPPDAGAGDPTPPSGGQPSAPREALASIGAAFTSVVDRIDRDRVTEIAGWFVVAGSALATLGFLMPWSVVVIGARGTGGYLDDWGLASPTHLFVVIALLGLLALGVLQNPVPAWLRTGVLGLALGGLLLGLTWPYTIGPLGAQIGAMLTFFGSVALLIGGATASWSSRHGRVDPAV